MNINLTRSPLATVNADEGYVCGSHFRSTYWALATHDSERHPTVCSLAERARRSLEGSLTHLIVRRAAKY